MVGIMSMLNSFTQLFFNFIQSTIETIYQYKNEAEQIKADKDKNS